MKATERLYLTSDGSRVVREGDPDSATLFAAVGDDISDADVKRYGLNKGKNTPVAEEMPKDEQEAEAKAVEEPPENKAQSRSSRKADGD